MAVEFRPPTFYPSEQGPREHRVLGLNPLAVQVLALSPTAYLRGGALAGDEPNLGSVEADVGEFQSGSTRGRPGLIPMDAAHAFASTITSGENLQIASGHAQPRGDKSRLLWVLAKTAATVNNQGFFGYGGTATRQAFGLIRSTTEDSVYAFTWSDDALLDTDVDLADEAVHSIGMRYDAAASAFEVFVDGVGGIGKTLAGDLATADSAIAIGGALVTGNSLEGDAQEFVILEVAPSDEIMVQLHRAFEAAGHRL